MQPINLYVTLTRHSDPHHEKLKRILLKTVRYINQYNSEKISILFLVN